MYLDKRRPGQSRFTTQRQEPDAVEILSGVFTDADGRQVTTGTPISLLIRNVDQRRKDYGDIKEKFRPGHADYTYWAEVRHPRLSRRRALVGARDGDARRGRRHRAQGARRRHHSRRAGADRRRKPIDRSRWDWDAVDTNPFFCPDPGSVAEWTHYLDAIRKAGSSIGAVVEVVAEGVPAGLGAPLYGKLDQDLAVGHDEHQRRQGRRDRRRHGRGRTHRRSQCRRDPHRQPTASRASSRITRRHSRRHLDRPAGRLPLRGQADLLDPDAAPDHRHRTATRPRS